MSGFVSNGIFDDYMDYLISSNSNQTLIDQSVFETVINEFEKPTFILLSKDHYAEITCNCIKQQGFDAIHIATISDLIKYFE